MVFKKISKELVAENITIDLLNNINLQTNYTPVLLKPSDEPTKLLECSTGYWVVLDDESLLKDGNKYFVVSIKECQIGRARYLLKFGKQEKQTKIENLCAEWKKQVRDKLDKIKERLEFEEKYIAGEFIGLESALRHAVEKQNNVIPNPEKDRAKLDKLIAEYKIAEATYNEGDFITLLQQLDIKHFNNPMMTVQHDDEKGMAALKNVFGAKALNNWDGDMLNRYAAIEIEKQYPYLVF